MKPRKKADGCVNVENEVERPTKETHVEKSERRGSESNKTTLGLSQKGVVKGVKTWAKKKKGQERERGVLFGGAKKRR